jgi:hypothetical protein
MLTASAASVWGQSKDALRNPAGAPPPREARPGPYAEAVNVGCVVASPRAALLRAPVLPTPEGASPDAGCEIIGSAFNFALSEVKVLLPFGSILKVGLGREPEGVWYPRACGWLGTMLVLEAQRPTAANPDAWVEVGKDGAADKRCGPSIGTARNIHVPFKPPRPGDYKLRARIYTYALPADPATDEPPPDPRQMETWPPCGAVAKGEVLIAVHVVRDRVAPESPTAEPGAEMPRLSSVALVR